MQQAEYHIGVHQLAEIRNDHALHAVLDIREPEELAVSIIDGSITIPMQQVPNKLNGLTLENHSSLSATTVCAAPWCRSFLPGTNLTTHGTCRSMRAKPRRGLPAEIIGRRMTPAYCKRTVGLATKHAKEPATCHINRRREKRFRAAWVPGTRRKGAAIKTGSNAASAR